MTYNVELEFRKKFGDVDVDELHDEFAAFAPAVSPSLRGRATVTCTIDAPSLRHAINIALGTATLPVLAVEAMPTQEFDRRTDHAAEAALPSLLSITEAAEKFGVSRQAIHDRIENGSLPAQRVGNGWVIPEAAAKPAAR